MASTASPNKLSLERIAEFKDDFLRGRAAFGALEKAFGNFAALERRSDPSKENAFGFDSLMEAGPWLADSAWGPAPAWDLAVAQERYLMAKFEAALVAAVGQTDQVETSPIPPTADAIVVVADKLSGLLLANSFEPQLVVVASPLSIDVLVTFNSLLQSPFWDLPKELQANWLLGADKGRLYVHWPEASTPSVYVLDVGRFGHLIEFGDDLDLTVTPVQSKVRIRLYESFKFEVEEPRAVWGAALEA